MFAEATYLSISSGEDRGYARTALMLDIIGHIVSPIALNYVAFSIKEVVIQGQSSLNVCMFHD